MSEIGYVGRDRQLNSGILHKQIRRNPLSREWCSAVENHHMVPSLHNKRMGQAHFNVMANALSRSNQTQTTRSMTGVHFWLDCCNSLFLSLTDFELRRLQLVQNSLCRVVTRSSSYSYITPQVKKLLLLPVRYRVQFKIGLITYKILNQGQPVYLRELIHPCTSSRNTRRSTPKLRFCQTPTFDHRVHKPTKHFHNSFSHDAPVLWNSFPFHVRNSPSVASFRKHLKTHIFSSSFPTLFSSLLAIPTILDY